MKSSSLKHWKIQGVEGLKVFYEATIPFRHMTENQIEVMLQRLASRHLTPDEIIACSTRRNSEGHRDLLVVKNETKPGRVLLYTTLDPYYLATVTEA